MSNTLQRYLFEYHSLMQFTNYSDGLENHVDWENQTINQTIAYPSIKNNTTTVQNNKLQLHAQPNKSYIEVAVALELKQFFKVNFRDVKIRKLIKTEHYSNKRRHFSVDIFLPEHDIAIEYDGSYWHRNEEYFDLEKNKMAKAAGITLIRVREVPLKPLGPLDIIIKNCSPKNVVNQILLKLKAFGLEVKGLKEYLKKPTVKIKTTREAHFFFNPKIEPEIDKPNINLNFELNPMPYPKCDVCLKMQPYCNCPTIPREDFEEIKDLIDDIIKWRSGPSPVDI